MGMIAQTSRNLLGIIQLTYFYFSLISIHFSLKKKEQNFAAEKFG
jgi:hypothetical protein